LSQSSRRESDLPTSLLPYLEHPVAPSIAHFTIETGSFQLLSCSRNLSQLLGCRLDILRRDANFLLLHTDPRDRFKLLQTLEESFRAGGEVLFSYRWLHPENNKATNLTLHGVVEGELFKGAIVNLQDLGSIETLSSESLWINSIEHLPFGWIVLDSELRTTFLHIPKLLREALCDNSELLRTEKLSKGFVFTEAFISPKKREEIHNALADILKEKLANFERVYSPTPTTHIMLKAVAVKQSDHPVGVMVTINDRTVEEELKARVQSFEQSSSTQNFSLKIVHHLRNTLQALIAEAATSCYHELGEEKLSSALGSIQEKAKIAVELSDFIIESIDSSGASVDLNLLTIDTLQQINQIFRRPCRVSVGFSNVPLVSVNERVFQGQLKRLLEEIVSLGNSGDLLTIETLTPDQSPLKVKSAELRLTFHSQTINQLKEWLNSDTEFKQSVNEATGDLQINSKESGLLELKIYLPAIKNLSINNTSKSNTEAAQILIVDDDSAVRDTMQSLLENMGYLCSTAANHRAALTQLHRHKQSLKVVLIDALLPDKNGLEILVDLKAICPEMNFLAFSGAPGEVTEAMLREGASAVITKPVNPAKLKAALARFTQPERVENS